MSYPKVYIVVLNWNGALDTLSAISSLKKIDYPYYEIVVIDNGSTDDSVAKIKKEHPDVKLIEVGENLGYSIGNNIGIKYAVDKFAKFVLVLNNDTLVQPDFLKKLVNEAEERHGYAIFSPQIRLYPKKDYLWYAGGRIFWPVAQVKLFGRNKKISASKIKKPTEVNFVTGAAFLARAEIFKKIGGFDGKFFCYWEETDWEVRAAKNSFKMLYVPESIIYHKVARSSGGEGNPKMQYYFFRNNLLFARKNLSPIFWLSFIPFFLLRLFVYESLRGLIDLILLKPKRFLGWLYALRGMIDFCRGKFGRVV